MDNADLDILASASRRARDSLTQGIYADVWKQVKTATSAYLKDAKVWFPDGKWSVEEARATGVMPQVNHATRELAAQISQAFRQAAIDVRRRCYLRGINAAQVNQEIIGREPVVPLDVVFRPKRESLRINGRAITLLIEADKPEEDGHWVTVNGAHIFIKGPGEQNDVTAKADKDSGGSGSSSKTEPVAAQFYRDLTAPGKLRDLIADQASGDLTGTRDYNIKIVNVKDIHPSQTGEDYINDSSRELAKTLQNLPRYDDHVDVDVLRSKDFAPIVVDDKMNIIDGNHRHAASILAGLRTIYTLVPTPGPGTGQVKNLNSFLKKMGSHGESKRESNHTNTNTTIIDHSIQGKDLDRVLAIIAKIPPAIRAIPKRIVLADLGGVHGEWENGTIRLNPSVFTSKQKFHTSDVHGKIDQLAHALIHEFMHAWGERAKLDTSPEWLAKSGWQYSPDVTPKSMARYIEKREGWPKEKTPWIHEKTAWFTRPYGGKSPQEDFADCARDVLLGWDDEFVGGGEMKRDWMRNALVIVDPKQRESDVPDDTNIRARVLIPEGDGIWAIGDPPMLPGGGVKKGEKLVDAAIREVFEETGLVIAVDLVKDSLCIGIQGKNKVWYLLGHRTGGKPTSLDHDGHMPVNPRIVSFDALTTKQDKQAVAAYLKR